MVMRNSWCSLGDRPSDETRVGAAAGEGSEARGGEN